MICGAIRGARVASRPLAGRNARTRARERRWTIACSGRAFFERSPDAGPQGTLDLISKNVVPYAEEIASPCDDACPSQAAEEGAAGAPPSCPGDSTSNDAGKGPQEGLKSIAAPNANE